MKTNFTKYENDLAFATLETGDVFYRSDDDNKIPSFYMVSYTINDKEKSKKNIYYNCVCLDTGYLDHMEPDTSVRLCKATINVEG